MGQVASNKRGDRKQSCVDGKAARLVHGMTDLGEPPVESYDKLVAWLAEMAERDNMELDTNLFLRQIRRLYNQSRKTYLSLPSRQNSAASNESNASSGAECSSSGVTRSPHLSCGNLGTLPRPVLNRQRHVSHDDIDSATADDMTNASMESLYDDSERDLDVISLSMDETGWSGKRWDETNQSMYLLPEDTRTSHRSYSASVGNLLALSYSMSSTMAADHKSQSALNLRHDTQCGESEAIEAIVEAKAEQRPSVPAIREIPPLDDVTNKYCVLDQSFLDDNMADILFSVEALWPVK